MMTSLESAVLHLEGEVLAFLLSNPKPVLIQDVEDHFGWTNKHIPTLLSGRLLTKGLVRTVSGQWIEAVRPKAKA